MRYWDSSALFPLVVAEEKGTPLVRRWIRDDSVVITWGLSRLEMISVLERRSAEGTLRPGERREALKRLVELLDASDEVTDLLAVRQRATGVLARQRLRAADAAQLAAALLVSDQIGQAVAMVTLDIRLAEAADREGLEAITWPDR